MQMLYYFGVGLGELWFLFFEKFFFLFGLVVVLFYREVGGLVGGVCDAWEEGVG